MEPTNPVLVEVRRANAVESRHRGAVAVVAASGALVEAAGDIWAPVFPRSAVKPLQALVLVESGAAERFAVADGEVALACASHGAAPAHVDVVAAWLDRLGLGPEDLGCGAHPPLDPAAAAALSRAAEEPGPLHNNCSGKHAGFLTAALHLEAPVAGYMDPGHAVQRRVRAVLSEVGACDLDGALVATDGCGVPTHAMPLAAIGRAMARLAQPDGLASRRAAAARRVVGAMTSHPCLVAGRGCFDTVAMQAGRGAFVVKTGAEGVHAAALMGPGLGIAVKIDDGAKRAAEAVMAALLVRLGGRAEATRRALEPWLDGPVLNAAGRRVGSVRLADG